MSKQFDDGHNTPPQRPIDPMYYYQQPEDEINLLEYWDVLWRNRYRVLLISMLFAIIGIVIALVTPPVYKAEVLLAQASSEQPKGNALAGLGGLASLVGVPAGGGDIEESLAVLKSRVFLNDFFVREEMLPKLFFEQWDAVKEDWIDGEAPSMLEAYDLFVGDVLSASVQKDNGMVVLAISWYDPEQAQQWANQLVALLNEHMRQQAITESTKSIEYLNEQLAQTTIIEMQQMLYGLIEESAKKIMLANVRNEYAFKVIDPAVVPERWIKPKRKLIVLLSLVLGLFFAIFVVFFMEFVKKVKAKGLEPNLNGSPETQGRV